MVSFLPWWAREPGQRGLCLASSLRFWNYSHDITCCLPSLADAFNIATIVSGSVFDSSDICAIFETKLVIALLPKSVLYQMPCSSCFLMNIESSLVTNTFICTQTHATRISRDLGSHSFQASMSLLTYPQLPSYFLLWGRVFLICLTIHKVSHDTLLHQFWGVCIADFQINPLFLLLYLNCAGLNSATYALDIFGVCFYTSRALISCINALSCDPAHQGLNFQFLPILLLFPLGDARVRIFLSLFSLLCSITVCARHLLVFWESVAGRGYVSVICNHSTMNFRSFFFKTPWPLPDLVWHCVYPVHSSVEEFSYFLSESPGF